jgi:hypothetical protein
MEATLKNSVVILFTALIFNACRQTPGQAGVGAGLPAPAAQQEVSRQNVQSTEQLITEVNTEFNNLQHELNNENLLAEEETMRFYGAIRDKRDRMNFLVVRYNESLMAGSEREAADYKSEINNLANEILSDIELLREKKTLLIDPENTMPLQREP